jgi:hypothetical protein
MWVNPRQVAHAKKGEQAPSCFGLFSVCVLAVSSSLQLSTKQQGTNVPTVIIMSNMRTSHFFIGRKGKLSP